METRWTKQEIPFSKAQLKYLSVAMRVNNATAIESSPCCNNFMFAYENDEEI